jgi:hypothetical protein
VRRTVISIDKDRHASRVAAASAEPTLEAGPTGAMDQGRAGYRIRGVGQADLAGEAGTRAAGNGATERELEAVFRLVWGDGWRRCTPKAQTAAGLPRGPSAS